MNSISDPNYYNTNLEKDYQTHETRLYESRKRDTDLMDFEPDEDDDSNIHSEERYQLEQEEDTRNNLLSNAYNDHNIRHSKSIKSNKNQSYFKNSNTHKNTLEESENYEKNIYKEKSLHRSEFQSLKGSIAKVIKPQMRSDGNFSKVQNTLATNCKIHN